MVCKARDDGAVSSHPLFGEGLASREPVFKLESQALTSSCSGGKVKKVLSSQKPKQQALSSRQLEAPQQSCKTPSLHLSTSRRGLESILGTRPHTPQKHNPIDTASRKGC